MEKKRPVVSISMLVSNNRRDTIEKCMESLVPLMEAVPSELIIVDTGCTDGSVDIARRYADKVVQFTWCKDFAAARNAGLVECTGEWFLYLDDDEWFDDVSELIAFFQSEGRNKCDALWYLQRNYDSFEGKSYTDTYVGRCVKMTPETKFCGKIHEWIEPLPCSIMKTEAFVHHYGYVYKSEEDRQKHLERNLTLEEEAVKENPSDMRMCCQLVQEYRVARCYEDALALCNRCLTGVEKADKGAFIQYLRLAIPKIYKEWEKYEEALAAFEDLEKNYTLLRQTRLGMFYDKALLYGCIKKEEKLVQSFLNYLKEFACPPKKGEPEFPVMDFAQYQSELFRQRAVEYAVVNMVCGEVYSYAKEVFSYIDWEKNAKPKDMVTALLRCYEETGDVSLLTEHLPAVLQTEGLDLAVYGGLHSLYEKCAEDFEKREKLLADLDSLKLQSGNFPFFRLLYTESKGITTKQDIEDYYEKSDRKYDAEVIALLFTKKELFSAVLAHTSMEQYAEAMLPLTCGKNGAELEALWNRLPGLSESYPEEKSGFLSYARMVIAEKRLVKNVEETTDGTMAGGRLPVRSVLQDYTEAAKLYAEAMYRPELLTEENCAVLPVNLRFVYTMEVAMLQESDFSKWGEGIKKAAKEYPVMLPVIKALLAEKASTPTQRDAQNELLALAEQLKIMVRAQLAEGKTEEAKAILSELATMLPTDEEVKEMLRNLKNAK